MRDGEKRQIEKATCIAFLDLYNKEHSGDFAIVNHGDSPDFHCQDSNGNKLNIEITLAEGRKDEIKKLKSKATNKKTEDEPEEKKDIDKLRNHIALVREGKETPRFCSLLQSTEKLKSLVSEKLRKDYGNSLALAIRDTSPLDWDWESEIKSLSKSIKDMLKGRKSPYEKGIWLLAESKSRIWRID